MSQIFVEHLSFAYPGSYDPVFEDMSFRLDTDWRLGLIGRNGRGKTTLLRLLMGEFPYEGRIAASVKFEYFPYLVANENLPAAEVIRSVCPDAEDWRIEREISLLAMDERLLSQPFSTLSGGEQTRMLLAALFLGKDRFLLIDEPTNHLDAAAREAVAAYLRAKRGFILVSHDRQTLDACTDHILSINRATIEVTGGNFSVWKENFERRQAFEETRSDKLKGDIARMQAASRRASGWSDRMEKTKFGHDNDGSAIDRGYVGAKSAKMMKTAKAIDVRRERAIEEKKALLKDQEMEGALKIAPLAYPGRRLAAFEQVSPRYGGRAVCPPVTFEILQGQRLALVGPNGCGKSSLLRLLLGEQIDHTGNVSRASGLIVSYVPQSTAGLAGSPRRFAAARGVDETQFFTILRKMGFDREQFEKDMAGFSQGQKKKALIAASLCERAHLYVWDEPLNYIDIDSRMQIEELLRAAAPTMLFVEHDGAFRRNVAAEEIRI